MNKSYVLLSLIYSLLFTTLSYASEDSPYDFSWLDPDKEVFVLQNRKYRKKNNVHINASYGKTTSGSFVDSSSIQGRFGYFFREEWGFEFLYSKNSGKENDTATSVRNSGSSGGGSRPFRRIVDNYMGGLLLWSPFYAKINTFNKIIYLDWIVGAGYGKIEEVNNREEFDRQTSVNTNTKKESHNGIVWNTALQFYLDTNWSIRADLTAVHYKAQKATDATQVWNSNFDATIGIGFRF
jgi:outer membrane beta-barrel protein